MFPPDDFRLSTCRNVKIICNLFEGFVCVTVISYKSYVLFNISFLHICDYYVYINFESWNFYFKIKYSMNQI